jgi:Immunity protein 52
MSLSSFEYFVRLPLPAGPLSPDWLGPKFIATLDALTPIDPEIFAGWQVREVRKMKTIPLEAARPHIAEIIGREVHHDDWGPAPENGYSAVATTTAGARARRMDLSVDAWGRLGEGRVELSAGGIMMPSDPSIVSYPLFRAALLAIIEIWLPPWSFACARRLGTIAVPSGHGGSTNKSVPQVPSDPTFPDSIFFVPWIVYLAAKSATVLALPPEILTERTADGGLLMTATEERLDPDNPEHARRARSLAETLIKQTGHSSGRRRPIRDA